MRSMYTSSVLRIRTIVIIDALEYLRIFCCMRLYMLWLNPLSFPEIETFWRNLPDVDAVQKKKNSTEIWPTRARLFVENLSITKR